MKETNPVTILSCFHRWCDRSTGLRDYIGGLLLRKSKKKLVSNVE
ncbi:hypothetical protein [Trichodesmium erythraeum]